MFFIGILAAVLILLVIIVVHEAGHFFMARYFGMQTPVVGIGLPFWGKTYKLGTWHDVEFRFHWLLFGAYVAIPEMDDETAGELENYNIHLTHEPRQFPAWQRMLVSLAGPVANVILAFIILLASSFMLGAVTVESESINITSISSKATQSATEFLQPGDRIISINQKKINTFASLRETLENHKDENIYLTIERNNQELSQNIRVNHDGYLGVSLSNQVLNIKYSRPEGIPVIAEFQHAWKEFAGIFMLSVQSIFMLILAPFKALGGTDTGIKASELHGILEVTKGLANIFQTQMSLIIKYWALLSIYIGLINLVPMLPLDGGHILFQSLEIAGIKGKLSTITILSNNCGSLMAICIAKKPPRE